MADDATSRVRFIDISRPCTDGRTGRMHKVIPWELVTVVGGAAYLEPVDWIPANSAATTEKEVTGYRFLDSTAPFNTFNCTGGAAAGPESVG